MTPAERPYSRWIEGIFALAIISLLGLVLWRLWQNGFLPAPFFFEANDTFMDWFNTAYWARDPGSYDNWGTLYPPLSFVIVRVLGMSECYVGGPDEWRACDWIGIVAIHAIFVLNIIVISKIYIKIDRRTAFPRAIALSAGLPMLFALERGNILLLCFTLMALGFGPLVRSARLRWLFIACAVNLKIYLIGTVFAMLLRRRWLWVEGVLVAIAVVYLFSFAVIGAGTPAEIYSNLAYYAESRVISDPTDIWFAMSYQPLISLLGGQMPVNVVIGSDIVEPALMILPVIVFMGQIAVALAAMATWLRPEIVPTHRVAFLGIAMAMITSETGGYTLILAMFFVFMERWRGFARPFAIICCYIFCLPIDYNLSGATELMRFSYWTQGDVEVELGIGLFMILRPGFFILLTIALSAATIHDVWRDIREQGWRERSRYRGDHPVLPGVEAPPAPGRMS